MRPYFFLFIILFTQCQQKKADKVIENSAKLFVIKPAEVAFQKASLKAEQTIKPSNDSIKEIIPISGKPAYDYAYNEINQMLASQKLRDLKFAVFLVENAYSEGKLDYNRYCLQIDTIKTAVKRILKAKNYEKDKVAYNFAIYSYMKESSRFNNGRTCDYDFDDYFGLEDWRKQFVTKLLDTRKGNCHSLPLLYKILSKEIGSDAYIALAPLHMYIKHLDENNQWVNVELTNGGFPSDGHIMTQSGITIEAVRSGIYMHPLDELQTMAYCMEYLALTYYRQYGAKKFVLKACNKALEYYPTLITSIMLKSNVYEAWCTEELAKGKGKYKVKYVKELQNKLTALYKKMDKLGNKVISQEQYAKWNKQSEDQKKKELQARK